MIIPKIQAYHVCKLVWMKTNSGDTQIMKKTARKEACPTQTHPHTWFGCSDRTYHVNQFFWFTFGYSSAFDHFKISLTLIYILNVFETIKTYFLRLYLFKKALFLYFFE